MEKIEFESIKNQTVFEAVLEHRKTLNFSMLQTILRKKDIKINGKKISENQNIKIGDVVTIYLREKQPKQIEIIFEDENILIANKPQGIEVTKKDKGFSDSKCLEEIINLPACHRLDKNTEGLVVFAKNEDAEKVLFDAFKGHKISKKYCAVVSGKVNKNGEFLQNYIKKEQNYAKICKKTDKNSKIAELEYKVTKQKYDLFLLDINLLTGRFHQIRAQLNHKQIFVLGDEKYGDKTINKKYKIKRQLLCAYKIKFEKLATPLEYLNNMEFEIKPSFDFEKL